jgi:putative SOS response-associated peptidase YedK
LYKRRHQPGIKADGFYEWPKNNQDRMPVIVKKEPEEVRLDNTAFSQNNLHQVLKPYPEQKIVML